MKFFSFCFLLFILYHPLSAEAQQDSVSHPDAFVAIEKFKIAENYFINKEYSKAINATKEAIQKISPQPKVYKNEIIRFYTFLSNIYFQKGDETSAKESLNFIKTYHSFSNIQQAKIFKIEGLIHHKSGEVVEAIQKINTAIRLLPDKEKVEQSKLRLLLGRFYLEQKNFYGSYQTLQKAKEDLLIGSDDFNKIDFTKNKTIFRSTVIFAKASLAQAKTLKSWYAHSNDSKHLKKALNNYLFASRLGDQLRQDYQSAESKLFFNSNTANYYEDAIAVATSLFKTDKEEKYLKAVLLFMEKNKSAILLNELRKKQTTGISFIPPDFLTQENQYKSDLHFLKKKLIQVKTAANTDQINELEQQIFEIKKEQILFKDSLKNLYPNYFHLTNEPTISLEKIRTNLLDKDQTLLDFYVGKKNIYTLKITKDDIQLVEQKNDGIVRILANQMLDNRKMEGANGPIGFTEASYILYQKLLAPLQLQNNSKLIIVPDGLLNYIPFEVLIKEEPKNQSSKSLNYLLKDHQISYAYSITLLSIQNKMKTPKAKAFGIFPVFENKSQYLSNSERELNTLKKVDAYSLEKEQATVQNFLTNVSSYDFLHFSAHAVPADKSKGEPAIYLRDSILYLSKLYDLNLNSKLVVLSASEAGISEPRTGEGIMRLVRGFSYSGVSSTSLTLWKVKDKPPSDVMEFFYQNLDDGLPKDEALHQAKLNYLATCSGNYCAPYYWAGLIQTGNPDPLEFKKSIPFHIWLIAILILVSTFFFFRRKK